MQRIFFVVCLSLLSVSLSACGRQANNGLVNPLYPQQALPAVQPPLSRIYPLMPVGSKQTAQAGDRAVATPNGYVYMSDMVQPGAQQYNCAGSSQQMNHSISQGIQNPCSGTGAAQSTSYGQNTNTTYGSTYPQANLSYGNTYAQTPTNVYGNTGQTAAYPNSAYPTTPGTNSAYPNTYPSTGQNTTGQTTYSSYNQRRR